MSDEVEKVSIYVQNQNGTILREVTDEFEVSNLYWPHLVQVFLEQLQGLGYSFVATPEEMVDVLEEFHQDIICSECNGCDEEPIAEELKESPKQDSKYPYIGVNGPYGDPETIVRFTEPATGIILLTKYPEYRVGDIRTDWIETAFKKVPL